ncbi:tRNA A-37 threonylcarbamoyl transferase component Bud32/peptidoglycan hydrolase-like protein with peptidoglycan-binding domain [Streptomyces umbrinus]|uniref:tRNA A-37 threonylcarbamoyl transferase component Bud32/peptidoglycan hydrolase-like protein with peptidoglycan-binding domain n=1 Tax=Streptomyces umbrinus TaxID=67370 RepID=A0ABU0SIJ2_9ACTN|nr:protein kinase [Streptomyces umbrinus]MDQ1023390.1 tRNA A-37 threonylcarbamoyl transferase component Bud32/peptidoglycan hydrolase-like protein with peptidoglycan-binding domain [Streptomyces umbrinus]
MTDLQLNRSVALAYAAVGMDPPAPVPLRKNDPARVGPYVLMSRLGSGGMGRVYLGRDTVGGTGMAAVKVIRPEYAEDPRFRKRFEREVGALDRVQGAHIVRLLGSGFDEDLVWVATEYVPGPTLDEVVTARGPVDATVAWRLMADMGRAVEAIWRAGIVHRDLKPSNVILAADGARVIDFGVVRATDDTSITATGQNVGTPAFMSPEQVRGNEVTAASDVFALASALAYAVTGRAPFGEGTGVDVLHRVAFEAPREEVLTKVAAVDADLAEFIRACLDKDPLSRPLPEAVFRTAIGHQLPAPDGQPLRSAPKWAPLGDGRPAALAAAPPVDPSTGSVASVAPAAPMPGRRRRPTPGRRRKLMAGAAAMAGVLVAGGITVALLRQGDTAPSAGTGPQASSAVTEKGASVPTSSQKAPKATPSKTGLDQAAEKSPGDEGSRDPATLDIRTSRCPAEIASGSQGVCVEALQMLLVGHGLRVTIDGRFGEATLTAVRALQSEAGITVDGKVGEATKKLLYGKPPGPVKAGAVTVTQSVDGASVARCLDIREPDAQVWGCQGTATQKWALYRVSGQSSEYVVVNQGSHLCLDAGTVGRNGQQIRARNCDGQSAQRWRLGGGGTLVSVPDGLCLDAEANTSGQDGQRVQGWGCAGSINQVWNWS